MIGYSTLLTDKLPAVAEHLDTARTDLLAFTAFPKQIWRQIWSNNPRNASTERYDAEPTSWALPDRASIIRLVGAVLAEQHDEWIEGRRTWARGPHPSPSSTDQHRRNRQAANHQHPSTDHLGCHPKDPREEPSLVHHVPGLGRR
ncbi:transposase [Mycobacterium tuberculosis]|uniref:transposase n=1 Tax=Mycobacterium tuberculosis TaxID=1773 RepID=UPI0032B4FF73